jgi:3-hydroxyisobutyrate dehydrogenase
MIAFLGMGLLGSSFVRACLKRGDSVNIWNRTLEKAANLASVGASVFPAAADAVKGADRVHLVLSDDAAVENVLKQILPSLKANAFIIDHTTTSVAGAKTRTTNLAAIGVRYQHAPVFMSPQNALDGKRVMLLSKAQEHHTDLDPVLTPMTGKLLYLGPDAGRAAALKLGGNLMLMAITTGLADMAAFFESVDVPRAEMEHLFEHFNPGASVQPRAKRMLSGEYDHPSWELQMARKDARLILEEAVKSGTNLPAVSLYAQVMDQFIAQGLGQKDWTVIGKDHLDSL